MKHDHPPRLYPALSTEFHRRIRREHERFAVERLATRSIFISNGHKPHKRCNTLDEGGEVWSGRRAGSLFQTEKTTLYNDAVP